MTNGDRADRLLGEASRVALDMRNASAAQDWNLTSRRAQEVVELVTKALLSEIGVDYPKTHDPASLLVEALRSRRLDGEVAPLDWLVELSAHLAAIRSPAFYHEIEIGEHEAREAADGAERALEFGRGLLSALRR